MKLSGLEPAGVLCEITNPDGTMARLQQAAEYAIKHNMPLVSIEDLTSYIATHNPFDKELLHSNRT